jgi:hypothetical protein
MSHQQLEEVVRRTMEDEAFLDQLITTPGEALRDFGLTEDEAAVIVSGDEIRLNEMLGLGGRTACINANKYHHSQHKGGTMTGQKPDLLPRVVSQ